MPKGVYKNPATAKTRGPHATYRHKDRKATSVLLSPRHRQKADLAQMRLGMSRSDLICLLIDRHASSVQPYSAEELATMAAEDAPNIAVV